MPSWRLQTISSDLSVYKKCRLQVWLSSAAAKPIYRWWSSKGMLALNAFLEDMQTKVSGPNTGSGVQDLRLHVAAVIQFDAG